MDRREFLEKFAKLSGIAIVTGTMNVACGAAPIDPPTPSDKLFVAISYKRLDGIFVYLFGVELSGDFSDDTEDGVPVSSKIFRFYINKDVKMIKDEDKIKEYLKAYYLKDNGKKESVPIEVKSISNEIIEVEFKNQLLYHKEYYLEANPHIIKSAKNDIKNFKAGFHTTSLVLSSEKLSIVEGDIKTIDVKKAFYKNKSFTNFKNIEIIPVESYKNYQDIIKSEIDNNSIILEAKKRGEILYKVNAVIDYDDYEVTFTNKLYIQIK